MSARRVCEADRVVVAELAVRICDRGPEPEWHTDRRLFGPWQRFEVQLLAGDGPRDLGDSPWDALCRLIANHRSELDAVTGVPS